MKGLNIQIGIRLDKRTFDLLSNVCRGRGEDISGFVRRAIRKELASMSYLSNEEKKALGLAAQVHVGATGV